MSRRTMLRAGALGGGVAATLAGGSGAGAAARTDAAVRGPFALFSQEDLNFETLFALGSAGYGTAEVGEVVTAVNEINARGATYQAYFEVFQATARRLALLADSERKAGHGVSARGLYLRAASYYDAALFFVLGTSHRAHEADVYAAMQRNWNAASQLFDPAFQYVRIPYGNSWLPGYFLRPPGRVIARPTVILNNGSDAQNVDLFAFGGAAALERGYNALIFEGPGQGSVLFERQIPFRPDWEHVITPIVDWLLQRPDVDGSRIALTGWSLCGSSVVRAAGYEHRLAAVVADPGYLDAWVLYPGQIRAIFGSGRDKAEVNRIWTRDVIPALTSQERFTLAKRSELYGRQFLHAARAGRVFTDLWDLREVVQRVNCASAAPRVTSPTLVDYYEKDAFLPTPGPARELYRLLPARLRKHFHTFTVGAGAEYHCAPMAPQTRNQVVFDWLDDVLT